MTLLDEFGQEIKPPYWDERAAGFVLHDADGERIVSEKPQVVSGKAFRVPFHMSV